MAMRFTSKKRTSANWDSLSFLGINFLELSDYTLVPASLYLPPR
jgi:hypothetical protein